MARLYGASDLAGSISGAPIHLRPNGASNWTSNMLLENYVASVDLIKPKR
jgi:hypothetical protein